MNPKETLEKWRSWIGRIIDDLVETSSDQRAWKELVERWQANPALEVITDAPHWLARIHSAAAALAIRTETDRQREAVSLWKLLDELERMARFVTAQAYVDLARDEPFWREHARAEFARWAEPGTDHLDPAIPAADRQALEAATEVVRHYVNREVAHRDERGATRIPTLGDLDEAVAHIQEVAKKYYLILHATGLMGFEPHRQFDDTLFFRRAWIPAKWEPKLWPQGWVKRTGEMEPTFDVLPAADYERLRSAQGQILAALRKAWDRDQPRPSPIRDVLDALSLPSSDASVMWARDTLLGCGPSWDNGGENGGGPGDPISTPTVGDRSS